VGLSTGSRLPTKDWQKHDKIRFVRWVCTARRQLDKCQRPEPQYNANYNPFSTPPEGQSADYSLYVFLKPLFDDRAAIVARFPKNYTLAGAPRKPRKSWVWNLGYALSNHTKKTNKPPTFWACKLCKLYITCVQEQANF
jgi:hypothetical protein